MRQYRPNVELQKLRYARMKSGNPIENLLSELTNKVWLPGGVRQISDAMMISDWLKEEDSKGPIEFSLSSRLPAKQAAR
jgi:hypothetical protein